jgi:hypothetical protein
VNQHWTGVHVNALTIFCGIFSTFSMNVGDILHEIVDPAEHCYESE